MIAGLRLAFGIMGGGGVAIALLAMVLGMLGETLDGSEKAMRRLWVAMAVGMVFFVVGFLGFFALEMAVHA